MLVRRALGVAGATALLTLPLAAPALAHNDDHKSLRTALAEGPSTDGGGVGMRHVANLPYKTMIDGAAPNGSDIEFARIGGREYAVAGTLHNGLQIVDVTTPTKPRIAGHYACPIYQGDVQVFQQGKRWLAVYTADRKLNYTGGTTSTAPPAFTTPYAKWQCVVEANAAGAKLTGNELGSFVVDISNPARPKTLSFASVPQGSHNMTVHPSGRFLYNSNSDLWTASRTPNVSIFNISNPAKPVKVQDYGLPVTPYSLGSESHDITFNATGTRAYVAAVSQTLILDTTDPAAPKLLTKIVDPAINVVHQSDPVTLTAKDGTKRTALIITDERAGAAGGAECPGGGLHVYDITDELAPEKLGAWFIGDIEPTAGAVCTSHVLKIYPEQKLLTIAWYTKGVRVLDISGLADVEGDPTAMALGDGVGMEEIGSYTFPDSDTWAFKTNKIAKDGTFYGYGNDMSRGLDVYRFDRKLGPTGTAAAGFGSDLPWAPIGGLTVLLVAAVTAHVVGLRRTRGGAEPVPA